MSKSSYCKYAGTRSSKTIEESFLYAYLCENFEYKISFTSSSSAANKWEKAINPNSKTAWSGTLVFGLQLESVKKAREAKNRELKSIENCSNHTILRYAKKFGSQALELLKSKKQDNYSKKDLVNIKAIDYSVNNYNFHIDFGKEDLVKTKQNQLATVQALDKAKISREDSTEVENVDPKEITNMARIGAQRSAKDLLNYIIPYLEQIKILKYTNPVVHLRILGDGQNVGRKNKHVMVMIMILNDIDHHYESDFTIH
ncbi:hypothetical protein C2G38_2051755 [Gigaspora rosea]|uniref:Uncharacterized protein n=1 Tax=Gigaspora rosea TaxID=44941 RepID=A0A397TTR4_9GLOM|nr:hypothetical protein C2G38_2051755 [Gigaspora rosea]